MHAEQLQRTIDRFRRELRRAVRLRVAWQVAAVAGCGFWVWLTVDRTLELSVGARAASWTVLALVVLFWFVVRGWPLLRKDFSDHEIAQLIARRRPDAGDAIETAIDLSLPDHSGVVSPHLAEATYQRADTAARGLDGLRLTRDPLDNAWAAAAMIAWSAVAVLFIASPRVGGFLVERMALGGEPWPRSVRLIPEGFEQADQDGVWRRRVARGASIELGVEAVATAPRHVPRSMRSRLVWGSGPWERRDWVRVGAPTDEPAAQRFRTRLDEVSEDLRLTLRAGDGRARLELLAVARPVVTGLRAVVEPPAYLGRPRIECAVTALPVIPEGARLTLAARANKRLMEVVAELVSIDASRSLLKSVLAEDGRGFEVLIPQLFESGMVEFRWTDTDRVTPESPLGLRIEAKRDESPTVVLRRDALGEGVTPEGMLRLRVVAHDDHCLARVGLLIGLDDEPEFEAPVVAAVGAEVDAACDVDLLTLGRLRPTGGKPIDPGMRLRVRALAEDAYDLRPREPSMSESIVFEVVTAEEVLVRLGVRERELRGRLEAALSDARRLAYTVTRLAGGKSKGADRVRADCELEAQKLRADVAGVAEGFARVRDAIENNRLDQPALVDRLALRVIGPLETCDTRCLAPLIKEIAAASESGWEAPHQSVVGAIAAIEQVLSQIESNDSYNLVVAELRDLIREQRSLNRATETERNERDRRLLLGLPEETP